MRLTLRYICKLHLPLLALVSFFFLQLLSYATEIKETKRVMVLYAYYEDFSLGPGLCTRIAFKATLPGLSQK